MPYNKNIIGFMLETELRVVEKLAMQVPSHGVIVEVGSFCGRTAVCWALSAPTATVYCIDDFYEHDWVYEHYLPLNFSLRHCMPITGETYNTKKDFLKNTEGIKNIKMIQGHSPNIEYDGKEIDLFFLDGMHHNPDDWNNLCYWAPLVKEGGKIVGHDYNSNEFPDVVENTKRLEKILGVSCKTYPYGNIWSIDVNRKITKEEMLEFPI